MDRAIRHHQKSTLDLDCAQAEGLNTLPNAEVEERI